MTTIDAIDKKPSVPLQGTIYPKAFRLLVKIYPAVFDDGTVTVDALVRNKGSSGQSWAQKIGEKFIPQESLCR